MAACILLSLAVSSGPGQAINPSGPSSLPWVVAEATKTGDQYACPAGSHLLLTVAEVNTPPTFVLDFAALGIDGPTILFVGGAGFAVVLASFLCGWAVGVGKDLIKQIG